MHKLIRNEVAGLASGALWGLNSVLNAMVLNAPFFAGFLGDSSYVSTFYHDTLSFTLLFILILISKGGRSFFKTLFSKSGFIVALAALMGGPLGMTAFMMSIQQLGASLTTSITALYPAVGLVLTALFLKEKISKKTVIGIFITIIAIVFMGLGAQSRVENLPLGLFFAVLCIIGWAGEITIISYALKDDVSTLNALGIRQLITAVTYGFIILPILKYNPITILVQGAQDPSIWILIAAMAAGTFSYLFYYQAIDDIGTSRAMALNITYPAWSFIFELIILGLFNAINLVFIVLILVGAFVSIPKESHKVEPIQS